MWVFHNITLHRATNSTKSRAKIRFAFHYVDYKYYTASHVHMFVTSYHISVTVPVY